ncbi:MAG: Asp-tRNA(Asn)/Glu-tRNA(Gln) amidotransferase subunit GatC [Candidatus Colwellbacteria bacterium]|nr:Asp-tRNA(Asn)/Glu-tRNA(Gln) amidotransferase subunit GatC [Candidatus Colwellbacteria bacterium]
MKFDIKYFAKLARIKLTSDEEKRFERDLSEILEHFKQLQEVDTSEIEPMTGGTELRNVFREDESREARLDRTGVEQFPEKKDDFLSVPKVFE